MKKDIFVGTWLPKSLAEIVERQARLDNRSVSGYIRHVLSRQTQTVKQTSSGAEERK